MSLMTVNDNFFGGGQKYIATKISFHVEHEGQLQNGHATPMWTTEANVCDGDISCDAILGYGWLAQQILDVLPWRNALQLHDPPRWIMVGKPFRHFELLNLKMTLRSQDSLPTAHEESICVSKMNGRT